MIFWKRQRILLHYPYLGTKNKFVKVKFTFSALNIQNQNIVTRHIQKFNWKQFHINHNRAHIQQVPIYEPYSNTRMFPFTFVTWPGKGETTAPHPILHSKWDTFYIESCILPRGEAIHCPSSHYSILQWLLLFAGNIFPGFWNSSYTPWSPIHPSFCTI